MSFPVPPPAHALLITVLAAMPIVLPVVGLVVAVTPYVVAGLVALFRRDRDSFVPHRAAAHARAFATGLLIMSGLAWVAIQPRYFRPGVAPPPKQADLADGTLRASLTPTVEALIDSVPCAGVVVGIVQPAGNQVLGFGRRSIFSSAAPDGETVFEIGGMTQVFTASLLARMVEANAVRMDQPVQALLPDSVSMPMAGGRPIQLQDLATWSSGLPRLAGNPASPLLEMFPPFSRAEPPRSSKWLYDHLSSLEIEHVPGTRVDDSDLGMVLLGHALARAAKTDYETLLERQICVPLGLKDTRVALTPGMRSRFASGMQMGWGSYRGWYVASPTRRWPQRGMPGATDLCSTAHDLLTLLRAHLASFPLDSALSETRRARLATEGRASVGLGWFVEPAGTADALVWQHGSSGASRSYMAFLKEQGVGVVVLANAPIDVDLLGKTILNRLLASSAPAHPLAGRQTI
jgi:CubicO group peptidase (beta-lactamase class C family)